jgi:hypothetical protein
VGLAYLRGQVVEALSLAKLGKLLCQHLPCYNSAWYIVGVGLVAVHDVLSHLESKHVPMSLLPRLTHHFTSCTSNLVCGDINSTNDYNIREELWTPHKILWLVRICSNRRCVVCSQRGWRCVKTVTIAFQIPEGGFLMKQIAVFLMRI